MFSYLPNLKSFSDEKLTIEQLIDVIKNHPNKDKIERIRSVEYKCDEYVKAKEALPCITPHGIFKGLKKDDLSCMSGYLYFDIDGFQSEVEMCDTIKKLNEDFSLAMICRSVGGKGISMLIRVLELNKDNFTDVYNYVGGVLRNRGYNIDKAAGGLCRKMIVSYDVNVIYNENNIFEIDNYLLIKSIKKLNNSKKSVERKEIQYTLNDTLFDKKVIALDKLKKTIKLETTYDKPIDGDFVIDPHESYKIFIPKKINDGEKHRVYTRIIYALYYLNFGIDTHEVFSFLYHVNNTAKPKMDIKKLKIFVNNICASIEKKGSVSLTTRTKVIHFNKQRNFSTKEKQSMSAVINGALRKNETIDQVKHAKQELVARNCKPTQKAVAFETGISLTTVKRVWNKEKIVVENLDLSKNYQVDNLLKKNSISARGPFDFYGDENEETNIVDNTNDIRWDDFFDDF